MCRASETPRPSFHGDPDVIKKPLHNVHGPGRYGSADHDTRHVAFEGKTLASERRRLGNRSRRTDQEAQEIGQSAELHTGQYHPGRNEYGSQAI